MRIVGNVPAEEYGAASPSMQEIQAALLPRSGNGIRRAGYSDDARYYSAAARCRRRGPNIAVLAAVAAAVFLAAGGTAYWLMDRKAPEPVVAQPTAAAPSGPTCAGGARNPGLDECGRSGNKDAPGAVNRPTPVLPSDPV